jgi:hypothetical protein
MDARVKPAHDEVLFRYGPGSAAHRFVKSYALRCVRGTLCCFVIAGLVPAIHVFA